DDLFLATSRFRRKIQRRESISYCLGASIQPDERVDHFAVIAMSQCFQLRSAAVQHPAKTRGGEMRVVLVVEILGAPRLERSIDARYLEIHQWVQTEARRSQ